MSACTRCGCTSFFPNLFDQNKCRCHHTSSEHRGGSRSKGSSKLIPHRQSAAGGRSPRHKAGRENSAPPQLSPRPKHQHTTPKLPPLTGSTGGGGRPPVPASMRHKGSHHGSSKKKDEGTVNAKCSRLLTSGAFFLRYHKKGKVNHRFLKASSDLQSIQWGKNPKDCSPKGSNCLQSSQIIDVLGGRSSENFEKYDDKNRKTPQEIDLRAASAISLTISFDGGYLDLELDISANPCLSTLVGQQLAIASEEYRDMWVDALIWLRDFSSRGTLVVSSPFNVKHVQHVDRSFNWTGVNLEETFELKEKVGQGSFATVYRAVHKEANFDIAAKCVDMDSRAESVIANTKHEIEMLKDCHNNNIVTYYGCWGPDKRGRLWIMMDLCKAGSIVDLLVKTQYCVSEDQIRYIMASVLKGLVYLHTKNITHMDIKCGNILITDEGIPKLADFGVSKRDPLTKSSAKDDALPKPWIVYDDEETGLPFYYNTETKESQWERPVGHHKNQKGKGPPAATVFATTVAGSPLWMAPEVIKGIKATDKADVWSLGISAIEIAEGRPPYADCNIDQVMLNITQNPPPKLPKRCWSNEFHAFVSKACTYDRNKRPSAVEMLAHPFVCNAKVGQMFVDEKQNKNPLVPVIVAYKKMFGDFNS